MNKTTLKALKGSIRKWGKIVAGKARDKGCDNCPLCQKFDSDMCEGCPVAVAVNDFGCGGTPYYEWDILEDYLEWSGNGYKHTKESLAAAKAELKFLKSLLPKEAK